VLLIVVHHYKKGRLHEKGGGGSSASHFRYCGQELEDVLQCGAIPSRSMKKKQRARVWDEK